tara:strand:- start:7957 stop:8370 length:414 start_codon:yes stop_codon:yes gene_type:complete
MSADLAFQKAIRARLVEAAGVIALVPAGSILDRNARPAPDPSIIIGEDQTVDEERISRNVLRIYSTLHVWKKEPSLVGVKAIAGAIRVAIHESRLSLDSGFECGDCLVSSVRYMRDPDGETSHGVVTVEALISEVVS